MPPLPSLSSTAQKAIAAYGGMECWQTSRQLHAVISARGLAFHLKRRPAFEHAAFVCDIHQPHCTLTPIGKSPGIAGVLRGHDVYLKDASGQNMQERAAARQYFPFGRRALWWDDLDMAYFACYAFWNYLTLPALLMRSDIAWTEIEPGHLRGQFPDHIPTHSPVQHFYFDNASGQLLRHDYTAEVIAPIARPANVVLRHTKHNGLTFPSARRVTPIGFLGQPLTFPVLIDIEIHTLSMA